MRNEEFEQKAIAYLKDTLSEEECAAFEGYLAGHPDAAMEMEALGTMWKDMDALSVPEPSAQMDEKFFQVLDTAIHENERKRSASKDSPSSWLTWLLRPQLAYGLLLLGVGIFGGYLLNSGTTSPNTSTPSVVVSDAEELRERLVLTLLEHGSANQRLQGVNEASKIQEVDEQVIEALLKTLNNDTNVNVRLAAIESLTNYVDHPSVRQGIVQSIPNQESPIIQVSLANLMLALQEKSAIAPFQQLLEKEELDTTVKKKIKSTIASII